MILYEDKKNCCGCYACFNVCPVQAISMGQDEEGFDYPQVDEGKCIQCGACVAACPFGYAGYHADFLHIYAAKNLNNRERFSSSSGGIFPLLARWILRQGGTVYGAAIDEELRVVHTRITEEIEIERLSKSKYVQSLIGDAYSLAEKDLESGKKVLFSGTPCQIMGLRTYLGKEYSNLYLVDVFCAGVPSPQVYGKFLKAIEEDAQKKIKYVIFRCKEDDPSVLKPGYRNLTTKVLFLDGTSQYEYLNAYFQGFLGKLFLRPSCHCCKAKNFKSGSDIQLGDFWELDRIHSEYLDQYEDGTTIPFGLSQVMVYTKKGKQIFDEIKESMWLKRMNTEEVKNAQIGANWRLLIGSVMPHVNRNLFYSGLSSEKDIRKQIMDALDIQYAEEVFDCRIGLWGSFSLRESIRLLEHRSKAKLLFQYRNSTVASVMARPIPFLNEIPILQNGFRRNMLQADLEKSFRKEWEREEAPDWFIFDLLEERYHTVLYDTSNATESEAFTEAFGRGYLSVPETAWKDSLSDFMEMLLSKLECKRIIIVEQYMNERYGSSYYNSSFYADTSPIKSVNQKLKKMYSWLHDNYPTCGFLAIPENLQFTYHAHRYGVFPENSNEWLSFYLAQEICKKISSREKGEMN